MRPRLLTLWSLLLAAAGCRPAEVRLACRTNATPQELAGRPSPLDSIDFAVGEGQARVCYGRPAARGRVVFGGIVPYDTLWRTGANEPTMLHLTVPAEIAGLAVPPGSYALYTVPSPSAFRLIVNRSITQWGITADETGPDGRRYTSAYSDKVRGQEVGRALVATDTIAFVEQLTMTARPRDAATTELLIDWETTRIRVPIRATGRPDAAR
ncbi:MAG: hypothetical protein RLZ32_2788 [Gemmatimonadota bacterium]